jgi:hypothetical protein
VFIAYSFGLLEDKNLARVTMNLYKSYLSSMFCGLCNVDDNNKNNSQITH